MGFHSQLVGSNLHIARANSGTGSPISVVTPGIVGEFYYDTATGFLYVANGLTNADWLEIVDPQLQRFGFQPLTNAFFDIETAGTPPASPATGDRYISTSFSTTNGWSRNYLYYWTGFQWVEVAPEDGMMVWVAAVGRHYKFETQTLPQTTSVVLGLGYQLLKMI